MKRTTFQVGSFEVNCTVLSEDGRAWIVDPGAEADRIVDYLTKNGLTPVGILLTHAHFDHIGGIPGLQAAFPDLPVHVHPDDVPAFSHPMNQMPPDYPQIPRPQNLLEVDGEDGQWKFTVIETPGHTPGGVCYLLPSTSDLQPPTLFSGDTLFAGSIGRTDLPGGDMATLMASLRKLKALPPETLVIPGHGPFTTIRDELEGNPFLQ